MSHYVTHVGLKFPSAGIIGKLNSTIKVYQRLHIGISLGYKNNNLYHLSGLQVRHEMIIVNSRKLLFGFDYVPGLSPGP